MSYNPFCTRPSDQLWFFCKVGEWLFLHLFMLCQLKSFCFVSSSCSYQVFWGYYWVYCPNNYLSFIFHIYMMLLWRTSSFQCVFSSSLGLYRKLTSISTFGLFLTFKISCNTIQLNLTYSWNIITIFHQFHWTS